MKELKDYVFYTILKSENMLKKEGIAYGIKRGRNTNHETYFRRLLDIDHLAFEGVKIFSDWSTSCEEIARDGNIIIVNTAIEVEDIKDRMYGIYLPTFPNIFQISILEKALEEFETVKISISVYGLDETSFKELRKQNDFNSKEFLKGYIESNKKRLSSSSFGNNSTSTKRVYAKS